MFKQCSRILFSVILACSAVGCGTVQNLRTVEAERNPAPYGGVSADLKNCEKAFDAPKLPHGWFPGEMLLVGTAQVAHAGFWLADVPFSAVGDTLTLPWTAGIAAKPAPTVVSSEALPPSPR